MKIRNGFVSNSSSSSFIVIKNFPSNEEIEKQKDMIYNYTERYSTDNGALLLPDSNLGVNEFGWENERYETFGSKLNFCALQILYVKEYAKDLNGEVTLYCSERLPHGANWKVYYNMLREVCKDYLDIDIELKDELYDDETGYIDHQSCAGEGENMEMFETKDSLISFLLSKDSYIQGGNDND